MTAKPDRIVVAGKAPRRVGDPRGPLVRTVTALARAGYDPIAVTAETFDDLARAVSAALATPTAALVTVGGDGLASLGVNAVAGTEIPLGIVPAGTGNDLARGLGIPHNNVDAAISRLIERLGGSPRVIDAGRMRWTDPTTGVQQHRWFGCMISAGFDAIVNERANALRFPKGPSRYNVALALELARLRPREYRVLIDDEVVQTAASLVAVGNATSLGGGMKLTPNARLDDGLFDVAIVQPLSRLEFVRLFPSVYSGAHVTDPRVQIVRARRVRIESPDLVAYADGERVGMLPLEAEVAPGAVRVFA